MKDIVKKIVGLDLSSSTSSTTNDVSSNLTVAETIKPGILVIVMKLNFN